MNKKPTVPAPSKLNLLRQICNFIPEFLVAKIARETKVDEKARTFSPWSHVVALVYEMCIRDRFHASTPSGSASFACEKSGT